jgi:hypothetical protein
MIWQGTPVRKAGIMRRGSEPPAGRLTVGALEAFLRDHDVPPDAEIRLRRRGEADAGSVIPTWDPRALVLHLAEAEVCSADERA